MRFFGALLFISLVASLPFFSLRIGLFGLGLPLTFLAVIMVTICFKVIFNLKIKAVFSYFDLLILAYLFLALFSFIYTDESSQAYFAFSKSVLYFFSFITLKMLLASSSNEEVEKALLSGVILGTSLFMALSVYVLVKKNLFLGVINNFSYYELTYKVFSEFHSLLGSNDVIKSADIMRNTIGEVFAFYFIVIFVTNMQSRWAKIFYVFLNLILVISMFSRRAFLAIITIVSTEFFRGQNIIVLLGLVSVVGVGLVLIPSAEFLQIGGRLTDFSDASRISQYIYAVELFNQQPLLGVGYGYKLEGEKYIHNFILASSVMMGISGFVISLVLYIYVVSKFVGGLVNRCSKTSYSFLLIIPIIGMSIGSTVEGLFTPASWIIFAIYEVHSRRLSAFKPFVQRRIEKNN